VQIPNHVFLNNSANFGFVCEEWIVSSADSEPFLFVANSANSANVGFVFVKEWILRPNSEFYKFWTSFVLWAILQILQILGLCLWSKKFWE
jgi:hypothetical protein